MCNLKKKGKLFLLGMICLLGLASNAVCLEKIQTDEISQLKSLYDRKQFFELRAAVENYKGKSGSKILFFRGASASSFFKPRAAINYFNQYIAGARNDDELLADAYGLLADNLAKLYEYGRAADTCRAVLKRLKDRLKPDEIADYENGATLYGALRKIPRQTITVSNDFTGGETGPESGWSIPIEANNQRIALGFDTGANISILIESTAKKLGVKVFDSSVSLGSVTSIKTLPKVGVLPQMKIGNAIIHNAVFLVLDDSALTFPDGSMVEGVIGFPIIAGFREIAFNQNGTISVSQKPSGKLPANMGLEGNNIFFRGEFRNKNLTFMLDTGASKSILYPPFLKDFENEIKTKYQLKTEQFTGVGGTEKSEAYLVKDFTVNFSGKPVRLPEIRLLTKALNSSGKYFYGNIGSDLIKRHKSMKLDFDSMNISFK